MSIADLLWRVPSVQMAWRNLGRNRVRTALATLGIVIGVVAIASLGIAGVALQQQATADLGDLSNEVTVTPGEDAAEEGITDEQVATIRTIASGSTVVPEKTNVTAIESRNGREVQVRVTGVTRASALYGLASGDAPDRLRSGALLSNTTATNLGLERGDPIEYDSRLYRIEGLITSTEGFGSATGGRLVVPVSAMNDQQYYDSVTIFTDGREATALTDDLEARFNEGGDEQVDVRNFADVQQRVGSFFRTLNLALLGIGSISLVVASVAILNVMLMSTIERRGEIGVLRAVGIRRGEVLRMILTEALFLGILGGILGAAVSLGVGLVLFHLLTDDPLLVFQWRSAQYVVYGFGFAVLASGLSGLYPAWKAATNRPVDALRG
ncbi:ABC transporter permease [Halohasta salina]|uniref:ABC transporter permease n=1 Tax=Halohasta salina TaxID=2961621 RepID=UPI0020A4ECFF|nr:ABC transporter permease [Halohasta salina]